MWTPCTWQQYSKCGLTRLLYSGITVSFDLSCMEAYFYWTKLFAFFIASMHCLSYFISALTVTSFSSLTNCSFTPWNSQYVDYWNQLKKVYNLAFIAIQLDLLPFLKTGVTIASFQSFGVSTVVNDLLNKMATTVRTSEITSLNSTSIFVPTKSTPRAVFIYNLFSFFYKPYQEKW